LKLKNKARREQIKAQADFEMGEKFPFPNGYSAKKQLARLEKELKEGRMPPKTRETFHLGAPLSDKDRKALLDWIDSQKKRVR
jgi:hypothetical protein